MRGRVRELERAQERLEGRLLRAATERELADELGVAVDELRSFTRQVQVISVEALEDSVAVDLFAPVREDWRRGEDAYLRGGVRP